MNNLNIVVYHPTLDILSDRTFRKLLKKLSVLSREIQAQEVLHIINASFLEPNEKQSLRDRIERGLNHIPAYYVEKVERGSLEVTISVTAFAIWLLQTTVGKSLEEAWKKARFHEELVDYLSSDRRKKTIERNIDLVVDNWNMDRFLIDDVKKEIDENDDIKVTISLKTLESLEEYIKENESRIDVDFVVDQARKLLIDLQKQQDEDA